GARTHRAGGPPFPAGRLFQDVFGHSSALGIGLDPPVATERTHMAQQHGLARTLVELADTLVADFDVVDFLHILALRCTELFDAAEAGLMLADQRGGLRVVASSSERARLLELSEVQNEQGPCLDCLRSGTRV